MNERDADIVARCLKGYEAAYADLYSAHAGRAKTYFLRCGFAPDAADDLTRETFSRLFRSLAGWNPRRQFFLARLSNIARRVARKHWGRLNQPDRFDPQLAEEPFAVDSRSGAAATELLGEEFAAMEWAVSLLDEPGGELVLLRYVEGLNFPTLARDRGESEADLRRRFGEVRWKLAERLRERGIELGTEQDGGEERIESLLRLWGAAQASARQNLPPVPPLTKPVRSDLRYALVCAACVVAGAAVAVGAMLLARRRMPPTPAIPVGSSASPRSQPAVAESPNSRVLLSSSLPASRPHVRLFPETPAEDFVRRIEILTKQLAEARSQREQAARRLEQARQEQKRLREEVAALRKKLLQADRTRLAMDALRREIQTLQKEQETLLARTKRLEAQRDEEHRQFEAKERRLLEVHLSALAPGREGLEALQIAARTSRLIPRCFTLRAAAKDPRTALLLDRVEATLIALEFLDRNDVPAMVRFEAMLRRSDLPAKIAARMFPPPRDAEERMFLAETDMIFSGVLRAE